MTETNLMRRIQIALSDDGARLFRNQAGTYELKDGRFLSSGLCEGASDLIGWTPVMVTPEMVGRQIAVFTAVEVKEPEARTEPARLRQQQNFIAAVRRSGGIAFFASFEAQARADLGRGPHAE